MKIGLAEAIVNTNEANLIKYNLEKPLSCEGPSDLILFFCFEGKQSRKMCEQNETKNNIFMDERRWRRWSIAIVQYALTRERFILEQNRLFLYY